MPKVILFSAFWGVAWQYALFNLGGGISLCGKPTSRKVNGFFWCQFNFCGALWCGIASKQGSQNWAFDGMRFQIESRFGNPLFYFFSLKTTVYGYVLEVCPVSKHADFCVGLLIAKARISLSVLLRLAFSFVVASPVFERNAFV